MRRLIVGYAAVAPLLFLILVWRAPWTSLAMLALSHALLLYPTLRPNAQWLGPVYTSFETNERELWLTIDDGPTADTTQLLDLLDRRGARATFFVKGALAQQNPDAIRTILARGHTIGNHSQNHRSGTFWCLPPASIRSEIDLCNISLDRISGITPALFRAPVGMKNPFVHPALEQRHMRLVGWSVRAFDAVRSNVDIIARSVEQRLHPGAIVVLHQGRSWSLPVIDNVVAAALRNGYTFAVPDEGRLKTNK